MASPFGGDGFKLHIANLKLKPYLMRLKIRFHVQVPKASKIYRGISRRLAYIKNSSLYQTGVQLRWGHARSLRYSKWCSSTSSPSNFCRFGSQLTVIGETQKVWNINDGAVLPPRAFAKRESQRRSERIILPLTETAIAWLLLMKNEIASLLEIRSCTHHRFLSFQARACPKNTIVSQPSCPISASHKALDAKEFKKKSQLLEIAVCISRCASLVTTWWWTNPTSSWITTRLAWSIGWVQLTKIMQETGKKLYSELILK